jgi:excisionase family DNA binding protein
MAELAYSVSETAAKLGISTDKVYELVAQGKFPCYRTGGKKSRIVIPVGALIKHLTDTALAAVKPEPPQAPPVPVVQAAYKGRRKKQQIKHWYDVPGCGGRNRQTTTS